MNSMVSGKQESYTIFYKCVLPKLSYAMRLHRPEATDKPTKLFDKYTINFVKSLVGELNDEDWGELQKVLVHLLINWGGLGLTDTNRHRAGSLLRFFK